MRWDSSRCNDVKTVVVGVDGHDGPPCAVCVLSPSECCGVPTGDPASLSTVVCNKFAPRALHRARGKPGGFFCVDRRKRPTTIASHLACVQSILLQRWQITATSAFTMTRALRPSKAQLQSAHRPTSEHQLGLQRSHRPLQPPARSPARPPARRCYSHPARAPSLRAPLQPGHGRPRPQRGRLCRLHLCLALHRPPNRQEQVAAGVDPQQPPPPRRSRPSRTSVAHPSANSHPPACCPPCFARPPARLPGCLRTAPPPTSCTS